MFTNNGSVTWYSRKATGSKLAIPQPRTNYCKISFGYRYAVLWDSLQIFTYFLNTLKFFSSFGLVISTALVGIRHILSSNQETSLHTKLSKEGTHGTILDYTKLFMWLPPMVTRRSCEQSLAPWGCRKLKNKIKNGSSETPPPFSQ